MDEKPVVIVISDLHLGGGPNDPGDDHVYDQAQFRNFIEKHLLESTEGQQGNLELFINGDFLEFAQTRPEAYTLRSGDAWCAKPESCAKLEAMLSGHADIFEAMQDFRKKGNQITIAAGNHDVDLFWPDVQKKMCDQIGVVEFILGQEWSCRFDGRLCIAHGHQHDRGNRFHNWSNPFVTGPDGKERLEMCPGTLFMVKFVNWLEGTYPFADNIKPISALAKILGRENKLGALVAAYMLAKFCAAHPLVTLESDSSGTGGPNLPHLLADIIRSNNELREHFMRWYRLYIDAHSPDPAIKEALKREATLNDLLMKIILNEEPSAWKEIMDAVSLGRKTLGEGDGTLELGLSQMKDDKQLFRDIARAKLAKKETQVVILGHTHLPDKLQLEGGKQYFNPGSWTRFADISTQKTLKMDELRDESKYPYQLNYVRIEKDGKDVRGMLYTYHEIKPLR
jgi:UDP-2,3-diacylglucosamine pyrophosphatase LpxH